MPVVSRERAGIGNDVLVTRDGTLPEQAFNDVIP